MKPRLDRQRGMVRFRVEKRDGPEAIPHRLFLATPFVQAATFSPFAARRALRNALAAASDASRSTSFRMCA